MKDSSTLMGRERSWHIASRWQEFDGELRSAVLRAIAVVVFYSVQLIHFIGLNDRTTLDVLFHRQATMISVIWLCLSLAAFVALKSGFMPAWLKYIFTFSDVCLVTILAMFGKGPSSPMVLAFFVVIAMAALRFRLGLVWFSTLGSMVAYTILVANADPVWFDSDHTIPILHQAITLLSIGATGVVLGQMIRSTRTMAIAFLDRSIVEEEENS